MNQRLKICIRAVFFLLIFIMMAVLQVMSADKELPTRSVATRVRVLETAEPTFTPIPLMKVVYPETTEEPQLEATVFESLIAASEPEPEVNEDDLELLAQVIYQEAGGDYCCDDCRRMVADVVLNRVADDRFPDTIEEVLLQEGQYGRYHWTGVIWPERAANPGEQEAVDRAYRIAEEVLQGHHSALYGEGYIWQAEFEQGTGIVECHNIYFGKGAW